MRTILAIAFFFGLGGPLMAQERIVISSPWGEVQAQLADNATAKSLLGMLPLTIQMRDHLRQEKTGNLPTPLAQGTRQTKFSKGTLGLWTQDHFVIYYSDGEVPQPGIIILGETSGDVAFLDRPGSVAVTIDRAR